MPSCGVCLCPCVRLSVTFVDSVKTSNRILRRFLLSGSHTILVFQYQTAWQYSDGNPLTGASNAVVVGRNRGSGPISGFIACCEPFQRQVQYTQLRRTMASL